MKRANYLSQLADSSHRQGALKVALAALLLSNIGLVFMLATVSGNAEKTIIIPPDFRKSFWVSGDTMSPDYIEQMGIYYASLILNYNPDNIQYQTQQFLKFVDPSAHGELSGKFTDEVGKVTRSQLSSVFYPQATTVRGMSLEVTGIQTVFVGSHVTEQKQRKYRIEMTSSPANPLVLVFQEIPLPLPGRTSSEPDNTGAEKQ